MPRKGDKTKLMLYKLINKEYNYKIHLYKSVSLSFCLVSAIELPYMYSREYWMIYRGPGFLAVVFFCSMPMHPSPPLPSVNLTGDTQEDWERKTTCWAGVEGGAKSSERKKAWSSINRSKISDILTITQFHKKVASLPLPASPPDAASISCYTHTGPHSDNSEVCLAGTDKKYKKISSYTL